MPFPIENITLPPREHKKVNYAEYETFSESSSKNNKKQNHGNYISWTSSEDAILTEQVQKFLESQKLENSTIVNEKEDNIINQDAQNPKLNNNENNLDLNKEKNLPENNNMIQLDENEDISIKINPQNIIKEQKINPILNINWNKIAEKLENKNAHQCQTRWQTILDPNRVKGPWTKEEDKKLIELVNKFGPEKWSKISSFLTGRLGKQCRERWYNHLNPEVRKTAWSKEEEWVLFLLHRKYGNSWSTFSEKIPGRTDNTIKNHWNSIMKKNIVGINNQYQEMIKGKTKEEIDDIEKNIMEKCSAVIHKNYNDYYEEKLKVFPMMKSNKHNKKDKDKDKENQNNLNNTDNNIKSNAPKNNSLDNSVNNLDIKTPTKIKKKIFENIKMSDKDKAKRKSTPTKNKSKKKFMNKEYNKGKKSVEKKSNNKKRNKYFNINDDKELKILKSGEKILQKDKNILIKEAENKYKEKQKLKKNERDKILENSEIKSEDEEKKSKKGENLYIYSNKKTAKKIKKKASKNKNVNKKKKAKFNVSKESTRKEKDSHSPNINNNNLNSGKFNVNNNYINNSNTNNANNNFNNNNEFQYNNLNIPYSIYQMEKFPYYVEDDSKMNFGKMIITDSKDNKYKKETPFPFRIPPTAQFYPSDLKNSSESSGGNITPDFRDPRIIPSDAKYCLNPNHPNIPQFRGYFNSNPFNLMRIPKRENINNQNNKISTDSNSIHSINNSNSMISANSAFKKSSSGSGSGSGRSFPARVSLFNYNNMADLNKKYFSNITLDEKNNNNKI